MIGVLYDAVDRSLFAPEARYVYSMPMYPISALQRRAMGRMITQLATSVNIENVTFSVKLSVSE